MCQLCSELGLTLSTIMLASCQKTDTVLASNQKTDTASDQPYVLAHSKALSVRFIWLVVDKTHYTHIGQLIEDVPQ